ncbi:hypothetical protein BCV44_00010 [Vibrio cyclitrophicus]|nr:hypothetical protein BCV44_00010 [Vibrio cyclitrophicus]PMH22285.1 hypothetical protein BCU73_13675 [Vibrio cyclitrophicus]
MIENFIAVIKRRLSKKEALIIMLSILSCYWLGKNTGSELDLFGLPSEELFFICFLLCYCLFHLIINWLCELKVSSMCKALKSKREIEAAIPHLDNVDLSLLKKMLTETVSLKRKKNLLTTSKK